MSNVVIAFLSAFLINALLQIPLIALVAALATRLLRNGPARQRHRIWTAALVLCVLLPVVTTLPRPIREQNTESVSTAALQGSASESGARFSLDALLARAQRPAARGNPWALVLTTAFVAIVTYRAVALFLAWRRTRWIVRTAGNDLSDLVRSRCGAAAAVIRNPIVSSSFVSTPLTVGALAPVIVLPAALLEELSDDALVALVGHEAAHIRRRDFLVHLLLEIVTLPIAFHPVTWVLQRRIALTRELACDEQVTPALVAPRAYARALVDVASFACGTPGPLMSLSMAGSDFELRIRSIVGRRSMKTSRVLLFITWAALATAGAAAAGIAVHPDLTASPALASPADASPVHEPARFGAMIEVTPGTFSSSDATQRAAAACHAGRKRDVAAIPSLVALLSDDTRIAAMRCYGETWSPALDSFDHPSPGEQAALALASIAQPAVDALVLALDHTSPIARRNAAWAIGEVRGGSSADRDAALTPLVRRLADGDAGVRRAAAFGLSELKQSKAVEPLTVALADVDADVRGMAAFALGEIRDPRAVAALAQAVISDNDSEVRRGAAWALGEIRDRRAVAALTQALADPRVRETAQHALNEIE